MFILKCCGVIAHTDHHNYHRPMKTTPTPHDALFKNFVTKPQTAYDLLDIHLPSALRKICDLKTLRLESGSFIENDLRAFYSDVLYSLRMQGQDGYVYALIEHQSSPDKHMAFRLMRYAIAAMQNHLRIAFEEAVDDYLSYCAEQGREPQRPASEQHTVNYRSLLSLMLTAAMRKTFIPLNVYQRSAG